jgi:aromatic ring-opening dioxygenase catalytic subunit (LigB family)
MSRKQNVFFISHGGGPMPLLGDPSHKDMIKTLIQLASNIDKPSAILLISAHWEEAAPTITSAKLPELIYDYRGFPESAYKIEYPCIGSPKLALEVANALKQAGIEHHLDAQRGFDHGMFIPLKIMFPEADIPCVQLSLANSLDPSLHLHIGKALRSLQCENLLVVGSGFSFHNMPAFFSRNVEAVNEKNLAFETWLRDILSNKALVETQRVDQLTQWTLAPHARFCHPREEHLLPLHVCYGLANSVADEQFRVKILNRHSTMFAWYK